LESDEWKNYTGKIYELKSQKKIEKLERKFQERLKKEVQQLLSKYGSMDPENKVMAHLHAKEIRDTIINLCCPSCKMVYVDFDGCMAIKCSRCSSYFCGWCHKKYINSTNCHHHVRDCVLNLTPDSNFYCNDQNLVKEGQKRYRIQTLKKYLMLMKKDLRNATVIELKQDLEDLGIMMEALFEFGNALLPGADEIAGDADVDER